MTQAWAGMKRRLRAFLICGREARAPSGVHHAPPRMGSRLRGNDGYRGILAVVTKAALCPGEGEGGLDDVAVGFYDELGAAAWGQADGE